MMFKNKSKTNIRKKQQNKKKDVNKYQIKDKELRNLTKRKNKKKE